MKYLIVNCLVLVCSLLVSTFAFADAGKLTSVQDVPHWRAKSVEGAISVTGAPSITSSIPQETPSPAKFTTTANTTTNHSSHLIWVYDADIELIRDSDFDGYYSSLRVNFDVDTTFFDAQVYAVVYLGDHSGYREIHTSSVFTIYTDASNDAFSFSTELLQGFRASDYDVLIEFYDANNGVLQDYYNHTHDADLSLLPLESSEYEQRPSASIPAPQEHGGALSIPLLLSLLLVLKMRRKI